MKVFVAGGTGVIGRRAVRQLIERGHDVSALVRSDAKAELARSLGATPVEASLFDGDAVRDAVVGHEVVVNLATHIPPVSKSASASAWAENDRIRTEGAANLVDAALAAGARRYIQESLAFLYDDHGDEWIDESEPMATTAFTDGVAAAEAAAQRFADGGGDRVVLRFGQFYAPEASHSQSALKAAKRGWALIPGAPGNYLPSIAADDAAAAVVAAVDAPPGVYNIVDSDPVTRGEWGQIMAGAVGRRRLHPMPRLASKMAARRAPNMVSSQRVSNRRFRESTGWTPQYPSMREGVALLTATDAHASAGR